MALVWKTLTFQGGDTLLETLLNLCCCRLHDPDSKDPILNKVSGSLGRGQLIAILGPRGSGKSTLFNCLTNGSHNGNGFSGTIYVTFSGPVGTSYLTQNAADHVLMNLTVAESLRYASKLKNPHFQNSDHSDAIKIMLEKLMLEKAKDNMVEVISGGQLKRLAVGLELIADKKPNFLILDEPLSGLDSFSGVELVKILKQFSQDYGMATLVTYHQPSFQILAQFNQVYVMSGTGDCIYYNTPNGILAHLRNFDCSYDKNDSPADILIKVGSSVERRKNIKQRETETTPTEEDILKRKHQEICTAMAAVIKGRNFPDPGVNVNIMTETGICKNITQFRIGALLTLFIRSLYTSILRQKKLILIRAALHFVVAGVLAGLYNSEIGLAAGCFIPKGFDPKNCSCIPTEEELRKESITTQNVKFQFFSLLFLMFAALMPTVLTFPAEIKLFLNEHRNGWYTTFTYYFSKTIIEIPVQLIFSGGYTLFLYWYSQQIGIDLDKWYMGWRFLNFLSVTWISCFIAQGLGFLIGIACVNSFSISVIVSSSVLLFLFLFSGFFVKVVEMQSYVLWITNLSFIRFAFESLLIVLYGYNRCTSSPAGTTAPIVLFTFGLEDSDYSTNWIWLIGHLIITRVLAFVFLKSRAEPDFISIKQSGAFVRGLQKRVTPCFKKIGNCCFLCIKVLMILFIIQLIIALIVGAAMRK